MPLQPKVFLGLALFDCDRVGLNAFRYGWSESRFHSRGIRPGIAGGSTASGAGAVEPSGEPFRQPGMTIQVMIATTGRTTVIERTTSGQVPSAGNCSMITSRSSRWPPRRLRSTSSSGPTTPNGRTRPWTGSGRSARPTGSPPPTPPRRNWCRSGCHPRSPPRQLRRRPHRPVANPTVPARQHLQAPTGTMPAGRSSSTGSCRRPGTCNWPAGSSGSARPAPDRSCGSGPTPP